MEIEYLKTPHWGLVPVILDGITYKGTLESWKLYGHFKLYIKDLDHNIDEEVLLLDYEKSHVKTASGYYKLI